MSGSQFVCDTDFDNLAYEVTVIGMSVYVYPEDRYYGGYDYGGVGITGRRITKDGVEIISAGYLQPFFLCAVSTIGYPFLMGLVPSDSQYYLAVL